MSGQFGVSAVRLAGLAARALAWRPGEFWAATPAELAAALAPPAGSGGGDGLRRDELNRLMDRDNGRRD